MGEVIVRMGTGLPAMVWQRVRCLQNRAFCGSDSRAWR